jgi:hypothetical protein
MEQVIDPSRLNGTANPQLDRALRARIGLVFGR